MAYPDIYLYFILILAFPEIYILISIRQHVLKNTKTHITHAVSLERRELICIGGKWFYP